MRRVVVYGSGGAGKSTLASRLAEGLGGKHVEIDELAYDAAGVHVEQSHLQERFAVATSVDSWVVEGMHRDQLTAAIPSADLFVWLDLPRRTIARRLLSRTAEHLLTRRRRHGRHVTIRSMLRRDVPFIVKTVRHVPRRRQHGQMLTDLALSSGVAVVHLTSVGAGRKFMDDVLADRTNDGS